MTFHTLIHIRDRDLGEHRPITLALCAETGPVWLRWFKLEVTKAIGCNCEKIYWAQDADFRSRFVAFVAGEKAEKNRPLNIRVDGY